MGQNRPGEKSNISACGLVRTAAPAESEIQGHADPQLLTFAAMVPVRFGTGICEWREGQPGRFCIPKWDDRARRSRRRFCSGVVAGMVATDAGPSQQLPGDRRTGSRPGTSQRSRGDRNGARDSECAGHARRRIKRNRPGGARIRSRPVLSPIPTVREALQPGAGRAARRITEERSCCRAAGTNATTRVQPPPKLSGRSCFCASAIHTRLQQARRTRVYAFLQARRLQMICECRFRGQAAAASCSWSARDQVGRRRIPAAAAFPECRWLALLRSFFRRAKLCRLVPPDLGRSLRDD